MLFCSREATTEVREMGNEQLYGKGKPPVSQVMNSIKDCEDRSEIPSQGLHSKAEPQNLLPKRLEVESRLPPSTKGVPTKGSFPCPSQPISMGTHWYGENHDEIGWCANQYEEVRKQVHYTPGS